jgi:hypothetical protein
MCNETRDLVNNCYAKGFDYEKVFKIGGIIDYHT